MMLKYVPFPARVLLVLTTVTFLMVGCRLLGIALGLVNHGANKSGLTRINTNLVVTASH